MSVLIDIFSFFMILAFVILGIALFMYFAGPFLYLFYMIPRDIIRFFMPKKRLTTKERIRIQEREKAIYDFFHNHKMHW